MNIFVRHCIKLCIFIVDTLLFSPLPVKLMIEFLNITSFIHLFSALSMICASIVCVCSNAMIKMLNEKTLVEYFPFKEDE